MDYKLNNLPKEVLCNHSDLNDFPELMFGETRSGQVVFDATAYCQAVNIEELGYQTFSRVNKRYIEALLKNSQLAPNQLFYLNTNGHELMDISLMYLFLAFVNPDIFVYFNTIIGDAIERGIAFSDGFAVSLAMERLSAELLKEVVNLKSQNDGEGS